MLSLFCGGKNDDDNRHTKRRQHEKAAKRSRTNGPHRKEARNVFFERETNFERERERERKLTEKKF
tara:strand:- start:253 stop:450 length:198 start_codon:yes stop_codon:yes gene_type:complete